MKRMALILIVGLGLIVGGCGGSSDDDSSSASEGTTSAEATTTEATADESNAAESSPALKEAKSGSGKKTEPKITFPSGPPPKELEVKDLEEGTGATAEAGKGLTVQYVGGGYDSKQVFESSWEAKPYSFTLGSEEVIPGWEQGLEGMKEGGRRELLIPPELAYGSEGRPPVIGPNETLIFIIDLLAVE